MSIPRSATPIILTPMKYLRKSTESAILQAQWHYATPSHRLQIRAELLHEQSGFCAYTERYITPIDACEIEHFDDRMKETSVDSYWNWYAVLRWINQRKRRIDKFLPILAPHDPTLSARIHYKDGQFLPVDATDVEAHNLIEFLGWNDPTLAQYRNKFVARKRQDYLDLFAENRVAFLEHQKKDPENLSFLTVLEAELGFSFA